LPAIEVVAGQGYVELRAGSKPALDERIRICRFDVEFAGAGWTDAAGEQSWVKRGGWVTAAEASKAVMAIRKPPAGAAENPLGRFAWASATAVRVSHLPKRASVNDVSDDWTGFLGEYCKPDADLATVDESAILRAGPGGKVFGLVAGPALDVAANLKKMIDPILAIHGGRAVVCTPLSYDKKRVDDTMKAGTDINKVHTEQYIPALQKLVADYEADPKTKGKVAFVNIWEAMAKVRAEKGADYVLLPDGSHPNAEGHKIIADAAWPDLKRLAKTTLKELEEKR